MALALVFFGKCTCHNEAHPVSCLCFWYTICDLNRRSSDCPALRARLAAAPLNFRFDATAAGWDSFFLHQFFRNALSHRRDLQDRRRSLSTSKDIRFPIHFVLGWRPPPGGLHTRPLALRCVVRLTKQLRAPKRWKSDSGSADVGLSS